jgi:cell filamentation protein
MSDVITEDGIDVLCSYISGNKYRKVKKWLHGAGDTIDEKSKARAYELFGSEIVEEIEIGTSRGLQQIHSFIFGGLYEFAGQIRTQTISKSGFAFANGDFLPQTLRRIDRMADANFEEILDKYVEMNIAHPFMEGNGRATRIWLDLLLKNRISSVVDWKQIDKNIYLEAMKLSPTDASMITKLVHAALTNKVDDREIFLKGIDYSYYYEETDE